jgi:hypothetical protein
MSSFNNFPNMEIDPRDDYDLGLGGNGFTSTPQRRPAPERQRALIEGDRVLAPWEPQWLYPGTVGAVQGQQVYMIFDDGDRGWVPLAAVRLLNVRIGSRVYGRWQGGRFYYAGTVTQVQGNLIFIQYDDGDQEWTTVSLVRVPVGMA